ncbi:uncharacterized protein L969DRAFT_91383 [Mixia osmundae IAM 14324]|uniref:Glutathione S-transferase n=1 Tax=Mixia osmundae (strain CBS 9802 / IAM 14324 / JCM 22182 / KY 12970) TaxID=764103 RepID=G7E786_MIXOS|nr:uncharacterized protein L969DRAFT_91383 [Mixia osmundae IAM 14324]KEI41910.1 hypothetical protein L969DRAFT_91383 [Mixia osmundae IAM 14324]GAA98696.1 hypothetical protein E5Q_05384 [Mixia osmundae IAM 14324]
MADLVLLTAATPNGQKCSIAIEELRAHYGDRIKCEYKPIAMQKNEQKTPEFLAVNPNGRIPALTDKSRNDFPVMESAAINMYLCQHYDQDHVLSFADPNETSQLVQWIIWAQSGLGPMQGQANHFVRYAPEKIEYGMTRYVNETKRLYGVLEGRLKDRDYLVGPSKGQYSLADINSYTWVRFHAWAGIETLDAFPNLKRWLDTISERPAVQAGISIPDKDTITKMKELGDDHEAIAKMQAKSAKWVQDSNKL